MYYIPPPMPDIAHHPFPPAALTSRIQTPIHRGSFGQYAPPIERPGSVRTPRRRWFRRGDK